MWIHRAFVRSVFFCLIWLSTSVALAQPTLSVQVNKRTLSLSEFLLVDIRIQVQGDGEEPKLLPQRWTHGSGLELRGRALNSPLQL